MAYLAATALNEYRQKYSQQSLDKFENRGSGYGLLSLAKRDTPNLIPAQALIAARGTAARATKIPVLQRIAFSLGSTRSCTGASQTSTSALVTVSWTTVTGGFDMIPSEYENNEIAYVEDFGHKMNQMEHTIAKTIEAAIYTKLDTVKSTTFTATDSPFAFSGNVIQIPNADKGTYLGELYQSLYQDDYVAPFNIVSSPQLMALNQYLLAQGSANSTNTTYQYGDWSFDYSNRVTKTSGAHSTFFAMPHGSLAMLSWVDPDSRANRRLSESNYYTTFSLPILGINSGLHVQMSCADNTTRGGAGLEASVVENYNFSFDYALITPYISTGASPIFKADITAL